MRLALLAAAAAVVLPALPSSAADAPAATAATVTAQPPGAPSPADLPRIKLEKVVKLDKPIEVRHDPAGRLFMVEQTGRVLIFEGGKVADGPPYLDLSDKVFVDYECGLLGLAFHPKFAANGLLYVNYTIDTAPPAASAEAAKKRQPKVRSYVSEFKVDPAGRRVDVKSERVLLTVEQPFVNHKGGQLQFGPDGMLYAGFGDGGSGHDPTGNGQNPNTFLGKILRIDPTPTPDGTGPGPGFTSHAFPGAPYTVPTDNPFVGRPGWRPEVWALGLRNPWRFSFDRATGLLYAADVGQDVWEEVDLITRGGNYGWRAREGASDLHPETPARTDAGPVIDPIYQYNHDKKAASITGGYVYRGSKIPALVGWYVFGDYSHGTLFGLKYDGRRVVASGTLVDPLDPARDGGQRATQPSAFGEDKDGELYMADVNGWVYRIVGG